MKNLRIIESCLANGQHAEAGTIIQNVADHVAADLLANGRAVIVSGATEKVSTRDPEPENRDPVSAPPPETKRKKS